MTNALRTPEEAAERLKIGRSRTFALIASGELVSVKIGRSRRVPDSAIDEFIEKLLLTQAGPTAA